MLEWLQLLKGQRTEPLETANQKSSATERRLK